MKYVSCSLKIDLNCSSTVVREWTHDLRVEGLSPVTADTEREKIAKYVNFINSKMGMILGHF
jgi:hypothetical protein